MSAGGGGPASRYPAFDFSAVAADAERPITQPVLVTRTATRLGTLFDCTADGRELASRYPVQFRSRNKQVVQAMAYPGLSQEGGEVRMQRCDNSAFSALQWPFDEGRACPPTATIVQAFFDYTPLHSGDSVKVKPGSRVAWFPNFAHSQLFVAWDSPLLAQDELQALEIPALVSLRRALLSEAGCAQVGLSSSQSTSPLNRTPVNNH